MFGRVKPAWMSSPPDDTSDNDWLAATSRPGELYTVEGQIRSYASFARGLRNRDPRSKAYRRSMRRAGLIMIGLIVGLTAVVMAVSALF